MDLKQLHAVIAVAEAGSVTRAAEVLHLVQPAVSRQIRLLEDELDVPLFNRTKQGMVPTEDGRLFIDYARRALRELERARAEIGPGRTELHGQVAVGLLPSVADLLAEAIVLRTRAAHPSVRISITTGYAGHLAEWIDSAEIELGLLYHIRPAAAVDTHDLIDEPLWAVGPPDAGLDPEHPIALTDLASRSLVLPSAPHALRSMVERAAAKTGCNLEIAAETNSMQVQSALVIAGVGYTVLPVTAVTDQIRAGQLSASPLLDEALRRRLVLAIPSTRHLAPAVYAVADVVRESVAEAASSESWPLARWIGGRTTARPQRRSTP
ncbi:MAG: LysR family transcriptional regulator [Pseudonocardia sp.]|nr:LysR family transcriptional regulator [Pseudonocardia sp.]